MVSHIMERDDVKLGAFVEWAIAIGVNKSNEIENDPARFDETKLFYANRTRKSSRDTIKSLKDQLAEAQALIESLKNAA
jgi:hypothetical protein